MPKRVVFTARNCVSVEPFELTKPGPGKVRIEVGCSLMSTGTENIVLAQRFEEGSHWARYGKLPFYPGYAVVGVVDAVGEGVADFNVGDRVVGRGCHATHAIVEAARCFKIPRGIEPQAASWFALAKIALHGALAARYELGDSVLIIGAGPIGQMSVRWARAAGVSRIVCCDKDAGRLPLAQRGGATHTFASSPDEARDDIRGACDAELPRVVIDTTGNPFVLPTALSLARVRGQIVLLGDAPAPAAQHLTSDVITRGLSITGVHDGCYLSGWNEPRMYGLFFDLLATGRFDVSGLITHTFPGDEAPNAYTIANTHRGETMGLLFEWS